MQEQAAQSHSYPLKISDFSRKETFIYLLKHCSARFLHVFFAVFPATKKHVPYFEGLTIMYL